LKLITSAGAIVTSGVKGVQAVLNGAKISKDVVVPAQSAILQVISKLP
jgi:hypothetical protein